MGRCTNIKMKVLSHVLQTFFVLKGCRVVFVSPRRKLRGQSRKNYEANKALAVQLCRSDLVGMPPSQWRLM